MAPGIQAVVHATQAWLQSSWHIQVPFAWLEACVEWLQEEAGGAGLLSQQQINQQALDQWLLTDLRDLGHPVLPERLSQAQKTELSGTFCVQVDSVLDISQPAYGQMQKWKGSDCANDEVSAVTQATQKPWEAKPTRMLLLQVTDGVQSLEAMEYQSVPALSTSLRPGVKLQLRGQMVCRLGMILLGPSNIKVLGGEVEDLVERNNQGRVLCRTLGLPEEQEGVEEDAPPAQQVPSSGNQEVQDLELDDAEFLASLEDQEEVVRGEAGSVQDSGYGTLSTSTQSSRSSSVRSLVSTASSRSEAFSRSYRSGLTQSSRVGSDQGLRHNNRQEDSDLFDPLIQQEILDDDMDDQDFPDEDFDDFPLDELDSVILQESTNVTTQSDSSHRNTPQNNNRITGNPNRASGEQTAQFEQHTLKGPGSQLGYSNSRSTTQKRDHQGSIRGATGQVFSPAVTLQPSHQSNFVHDESDFMDDDMDCSIVEVKTGRTGDQLSVQQGPSRDGESSSSSIAALTLTSPPFTYLCLLEEMMSKPQLHATKIQVKAFIVTLLGKLSSNNGLWRVCATISDGTGYLDVELSNEVLTGLLGFSVAGKAALKRDPARRGELDSGMRRCQEELVDMCCVMTIRVEPDGSKAVVTMADPVNEKVFQELERRVRDRRT